MVRISTLLGIVIFFLPTCITVKSKNITYRNKYTLTDQRVKVDGFYYHYIASYNTTDSLVEVIVFFKNGYLYTSTYQDLKTANHFLNESLKRSKYGWGAYKIDGDTIKIQSFTSARGNELSAVWDVIEMHGFIKDNAIQFYESILPEKKYSFIEEYMFFKMNIESDGTNWLMNEKE